MMILQWKYYPDFQLYNFRVSSVSPRGGRTLYLIHSSYVFTTKGPNSGASQPSLFSSVMILLVIVQDLGRRFLVPVDLLVLKTSPLVFQL